MGKDYYKISGIERSASDDEIRKAYLTMAHKHHPDKNSSAGAEEKFKEVANAYVILSDSKKKEIYDKGEDGVKHGGGGGGGPGDPDGAYGPGVPKNNEKKKAEEVNEWHKPCAVQYCFQDNDQDKCELSCGVRVMETADWSEFNVISWEYPVYEAGLSQEGNNKRFAFFSVYDGEMYSLGEGVEIGVRRNNFNSMKKSVQWRENEDVRFIIKGEKGRERWKTSCWMEYQGKREYMGTFEQPLDDCQCILNLNAFCSEIDFKGTLHKRSAEFFQPKLDGKLIRDVRYSDYGDDPLKATSGAKIGSKGVMLWSGGRQAGQKFMPNGRKFKLPNSYQ